MDTGNDIYHDKITQYSRFKLTARDMIPSYHTYIDTYLKIEMILYIYIYIFGYVYEICGCTWLAPMVAYELTHLLYAYANVHNIHIHTHIYI